MVDIPYGNAPATNTTDELKFLVGDQSTAAATELLSTKECSYLLTAYGSARAAAPHAARAIAADLAVKVNKAVGDLRLDLKAQYDNYLSLAASLERQASFSAAPFAGGISRSGKQTQENDTDRVVPMFTMGLHDDPANAASVSASTRA